MRNFSFIAFSIIACTTLCSCGSFGEGMLAALSGYGGGYGGYASYGGLGAVSSSGNLDYLLDPRYAMAQTAAEQAQFNRVASSIAQTTVTQVLSEEEQQYQEFCKYNKKADGSNYTKDEWHAFVGQAIQYSKSKDSSGKISTTTSNGFSSSATSSSRRCMKLTATDLAHCNGNGKCTRCNGKGRYYDTSYGNAHWVDPCNICGGNGKCPSCHGKVYR